MGEHMQRREFIAALVGAAVWPLAAHAQQAAKLPTIGFLGPLTPSSQREWTDAFVQSMRAHGWIEGRTVAIEYRWGEGRSERLAEIVAEFVRLKVNVIVTAGTEAVIAAKQTTSVIPIVFGHGGAVAFAGWPRVGRTEQPERVRQIGSLINLAADHPESPARIAAFAQGLAEHGWIIGRNVRVDYRWGAGNPELFRRYATELVAAKPDVILAAGTGSLAALHDATHDVPIVFTNVTDPVGEGFVESLNRPGGNISGFMLFESSAPRYLVLF